MSSIENTMTIHSKRRLDSRLVSDEETKRYIASVGCRLLKAVQQGRLDDIRRLIEYACVDVNVKDHRGWTPLFYAIQSGNEPLVKLLIEEGADVNAASDDSGATPLHLAIREGTPDIALLLLQSGANLITKDKRGQNPLEAAGDPHVVSLLVQKATSANNAISPSQRATGSTISTNLQLDLRNILYDTSRRTRQRELKTFPNIFSPSTRHNTSPKQSPRRIAIPILADALEDASSCQSPCNRMSCLEWQRYNS